VVNVIVYEIDGGGMRAVNKCPAGFELKKVEV
jgi:hypothetical protein